MKRSERSSVHEEEHDSISNNSTNERRKQGLHGGKKKRRKILQQTKQKTEFTMNQLFDNVVKLEELKDKRPAGRFQSSYCASCVCV